MSEQNVSEQYTPTISKEELAPGVVVYKDVIPGHHQLIPYIEQVVGAGMANWEIDNVNENYFEKMLLEYPEQFRDPNDFSVEFKERLSLVTAGFFQLIEQDYTSSNGIPKLAHDDLMLLKFESGKYFPPSQIAHNNKDMAVIVIYYLNDDYQGSGLEFPNLGISYTPKENEAIIFPAAEGFEYSITPLVQGIKYAVMSYMRKKVK